MKRLLMLVLLAAWGSTQAETYRWVDKTGKVHYGDLPSGEAAQVERKTFGDVSGMENADLPYETRRAQQKFPVTLYVFDGCGEPCQQARGFLEKRGIPFSEKKLVTQEDIDRFRKESGSDQAPTLSVGKAWLKEFEAGQWGGELDLAGYPRIAPYRPPAQPAKAVPAASETPPEELPSTK